MIKMFDLAGADSARRFSPFQLLAADDPVARWRGQLLDAVDGLGRKAQGYDA